MNFIMSNDQVNLVADMHTRICGRAGGCTRDSGTQQAPIKFFSFEVKKGLFVV